MIPADQSQFPSIRTTYTQHSIPQPGPFKVAKSQVGDAHYVPNHHPKHCPNRHLRQLSTIMRISAAKQPCPFIGRHSSARLITHGHLAGVLEEDSRTSQAIVPHLSPNTGELLSTSLPCVSRRPGDLLDPCRHVK